MRGAVADQVEVAPDGAVDAVKIASSIDSRGTGSDENVRTLRLASISLRKRRPRASIPAAERRRGRYAITRGSRDPSLGEVICGFLHKDVGSTSTSMGPEPPGRRGEASIGGARARTQAIE